MGRIGVCYFESCEMMNKLMKFNINNYVTVTLTEFGANIYNARYDSIKEYMPDHVFQNVDVKEGYVLRAQLWSLFQEFGPHIMLGGHNPFEKCTMIFDMKDFEE